MANNTQNPNLYKWDRTGAAIPATNKHQSLSLIKSSDTNYLEGQSTDWFDFYRRNGMSTYQVFNEGISGYKKGSYVKFFEELYVSIVDDTTLPPLNASFEANNTQWIRQRDLYVTPYFISNISNIGAYTLIEVQSYIGNGVANYTDSPNFNIKLDNTFKTYAFLTDVRIKIDSLPVISFSNFTTDVRFNALSVSFEGSNAIINNTPIFYKGEIRVFPYREVELPYGWYFANGDSYSLSSVQGQVLNGLSTSYKTDWNISDNGVSINLPNFFYSDGRGYFPRPVDGSNRAIGSTELDGVAAHAHLTAVPQSFNSSQVVSASETDGTDFPDDIRRATNSALLFPYARASTAVPGTSSDWLTTSTAILEYGVQTSIFFNTNTMSETRGINIGLLPCIYLGV